MKKLIKSQKLDGILSELQDEKRRKFGGLITWLRLNPFNKIQFEIDEFKMYLGELKKKGYIDTNEEFDELIITVKGGRFREFGGYSQEIKDLKTSNRMKRIRKFIATGGAGLVGLSGLLSIAKWFYHHLHFLKFWPL
jgi:hypothetical protein